MFGASGFGAQDGKPLGLVHFGVLCERLSGVSEGAGGGGLGLRFGPKP